MTTIDEKPLISIVTLNYNQAKITAEFLESTRILNYRNFEILVCDMASDEDPTLFIHPDKYENTRLLLSNKNLGFAGGNNWAMRQAKGDYFFIVNNDTEVTPYLLDCLLAPFFADPGIGVTSPKIKYHAHPAILQYAGFNRMSPYTGRTSTVGDGEEDKGQYEQSGETYGAHGCAMLVKRSVVEKTGMFPELFFLYYEEWDWSARIRKAGYKIWYTGNATIYHKESMSVGKKNPMKLYYHTRNRILYIRRNTKWYHQLVFFFYFLLLGVPKNLLQLLLQRKWIHARNLLKGVIWNFYSSSASPV